MNAVQVSAWQISWLNKHLVNYTECEVLKHTLAFVKRYLIYSKQILKNTPLEVLNSRLQYSGKEHRRKWQGTPLFGFQLFYILRLNGVQKGCEEIGPKTDFQDHLVIYFLSGGRTALCTVMQQVRVLLEKRHILALVLWAGAGCLRVRRLRREEHSGVMRPFEVCLLPSPQVAGWKSCLPQLSDSVTPARCFQAASNVMKTCQGPV